MGKTPIILILIGIAVLGWSGYESSAADSPLTCIAYGRNLPINNQQVLHWKRTTPNQFQERGHVIGPITYIFPDRNGHDHFVINIGRTDQDTLEVIYNQDFGVTPEPRIGMMVEACGDYITSTAQSGPYPPSPVGAIIHWVHINPAGRGHDPGFLVMDGILCGQDVSNPGPKPYPNPKKRRDRRDTRGNPRGHILMTQDFFIMPSVEDLEVRAIEGMTQEE